MDQSMLQLNIVGEHHKIEINLTNSKPTLKNQKLNFLLSQVNSPNKFKIYTKELEIHVLDGANLLVN